MTSNTLKEKIIEYPVVTIDNFEETITIHSHINLFGKSKMVLNKTEALLLLIELRKFVKS
jgi:hypothetical protein